MIEFLIDIMFAMIDIRVFQQKVAHSIGTYYAPILTDIYTDDGLSLNISIFLRISTQMMAFH